MRGFYGSTAVEYLQDGIELRLAGNTAVFPFDPWNVDRIEILHGPSTTLYGTGSVGGSVNVISRKPDFSGQHGEIDLLAGSRNTFHEAIDLTGPITPDLAYRFDLMRRSTNGFTNDASSGSIAISGALEYRPYANFSIKYSQDYGNQHLSPYEGSVIFNNQLVNALKNVNYNVAGASIANKTNFPRLLEEWQISDSVMLRNYTYYAGVERPFFDSTVATYKPSNQTVTLTSFRGIDNQYSPQYGDSANLTFKNLILGHKNELLLGFDINQEYFSRGDNANASAAFTGSATANAFGYVPVSFAAGKTPAIRPHFASNLSQHGFFAEDRFVVTDQLSVLAGYRYDKYRTSDVDLVANTVVNAAPDSGTYHVGVVYAPLPKVSFFARYATGSDPFTSLGNVGASQAAFVLPTGVETEAGVKATAFDNKVNATFSAYDIVKKHVPTPSADNPAVTVQVGEQSSRGLEGALAIVLGDATLGANGTVLVPEFDEFSATVNGKLTSLAGFRPQFVPSHSANLWASYNFLPGWQIRGDVRFVGQRFADNTNLNNLPEYIVSGIGLRYTPTERLFFDVRVDNLFNKTYALSANQAADTQWILGDPRTFTGRINYRF